MGLPEKRRATYEDLLAVPDTKVAEIIDGELYVSPRPAVRHANAASILGSELIGPFRMGRGGPGGWVILFEPELHFGEDVVVPDLAGWRRERFRETPEEAVAITVVPDWVCEVLSPSTAGKDRVKKLPVYAREQVPHVWFIDPIARTLEVLRLEGGRWTIAGTCEGTAVASIEPFEAIELDIGVLWTI